LIDATWGLPDSLMYHPHDSYEVDNDSMRIKRYLRCKTDYIDVDGEGDWRSQPAGAPWDWKPALSDETARTIASQAQRVARQVGHSAEVMFFVSRSENGVAVLPWFYCEPQRSAEDVEEARGYYVGERVEITDKSDLDALKIRLDAEDRAQLSIRLRPTFRLMRDRDFIRAVAKTAAKFNVPIELEGSQLSHSYYLLQGTDATVRCKNPWKRPERRQSFGKLVRDMVPVAIKRHGEEATVHSVSREDLELLLRAKVIEEAVEYYWSADTSSSLEELADLLELLRAAATVLDVKFSEIEKAARAKREERGGFEKGVVLVETREAPDSTRLGIEESEDEASLLDEPPAKRPRPRRVYRLPERRLVLPIAPPSGWKLEQPKAIALEGDEEAVVTYGVTTIRVQIRHRRPEPGKNQLALSDLLDPGET
jgi:predicted house-cleaning noncanonical NTP pyrophosphatase (MazG superfamily)